MANALMNVVLNRAFAVTMRNFCDQSTRILKGAVVWLPDGCFCGHYRE